MLLPGIAQNLTRHQPHNRYSQPNPSTLLVCGDYREVQQQLPDQAIDLVLTDPPYGTTDLAYDRRDKVDLVKLWEILHRVAKPTGLIVMFGAQPFVTDVIQAGRKAFRYELIWAKNTVTGHLNARHRPMRSHENILVFCQKFAGSVYHAQLEPGKPYTDKGQGSGPKCYRTSKRTPIVNQGTRHPRTLRLVNSVSSGRIHPSQKPLELLEWLVRSYSNPGDLVLDPFMGSGSSGVAALNMGRRFLGIEREAEFYGRTLQQWPQPLARRAA